MSVLQVRRFVRIEPHGKVRMLLVQVEMEAFHRTRRAALHLDRNDPRPDLDEVIHLRLAFRRLADPEVGGRLFVLRTREKEMLSDELFADRTVIGKKRIAVVEEIRQFQSQRTGSEPHIEEERLEYLVARPRADRGAACRSVAHL